MKFDLPSSHEKRADNPRVSGLVFDHPSVLKLIEWRWGLQPLTARDESNGISNLAQALNFQNHDPVVPALPKPSAPLTSAPCPQGLIGGLLSGGGSSLTAMWKGLAKLATTHGFHVRDFI